MQIITVYIQIQNPTNEEHDIKKKIEDSEDDVQRKVEDSENDVIRTPKKRLDTMEKNISKDHAVAGEQLEDLQDDINALKKGQCQKEKKKIKDKEL
jgi:hypothetical protein